MGVRLREPGGREGGLDLGGVGPGGGVERGTGVSLRERRGGREGAGVRLRERSLGGR